MFTHTIQTRTHTHTTHAPNTPTPQRFHTPRNILLALCGEMGELAECFQWKGEVARGLPEFSEAEKVHVGEELADVRVGVGDVWDMGPRTSSCRF